MLLAAAIFVFISGGSVFLLVRFRRSPDLIAEATAAYARGDFGRAASLSHRRLKEVHDDPQALRLAARSAARQDQDQKAMAIYHRIARDRLAAEDLCLVGRALTRTGQTDSAFDAYETARTKDPDHPEALAALAALYMRTDRYHAAAEAAERLAQQPAWEARAQLMIGTIRFETHDPKGAALALTRWLELDPAGHVVAPYPFATIEKLLVRSWLQAGQPAKARTILETNIGAEGDAEASWLLSRCLIQERRWEQAAVVVDRHPSYRLEHPAEPEPGPYVGEERCAGCHRVQYQAVLASRHATTFTRARDLGSFPVPGDPLTDPGNPEVTHQLRRDGDSLVVETRVNGRVLRAIVDYAFGSHDHFTTFVGHDERGRSFMVRMSYYRSPRGTGWDLATGLPVRPADQEEYLGKKMARGDGVRRCLNCHTTNLYSVLHDVGPEAADRSVGCETCHGPGGYHVAAVAAGFVDLAIASPRRAPPAALDQICAKCHGIQQPENLDLPRTDPVWLRFHSLTLSWSRCYTESGGKLGCVTCHDPHHNVETVAAVNDAKCLACHAVATAPSLARSVAAFDSGRRPKSPPDEPPVMAAKAICPVNPKSGCTECHMPRVWNQPTHSFKADHFIRIQNRPRPEGRAEVKRK
jgi:lipopolysaccharide biosynthesis regulator YciM